MTEAALLRHERWALCSLCLALVFHWERSRKMVARNDCCSMIHIIPPLEASVTPPPPPSDRLSDLRGELLSLLHQSTRKRLTSRTRPAFARLSRAPALPTTLRRRSNLYPCAVPKERPLFLGVWYSYLWYDFTQNPPPRARSPTSRQAQVQLGYAVLVLSPSPQRNILFTRVGLASNCLV